MKRLAQAFMAVVILLGFVLALTPIIGSVMTGDDDVSIRGKEGAVKAALARWFNAPPLAFADAQAVQQRRDNTTVARFSFSTPPQIIRDFINKNGLEQKELTQETMQNIFLDQTIPWWDPQALQRKTWFSGSDKNKTISLIYNDKTQRAVLVIQ